MSSELLEQGSLTSPSTPADQGSPERRWVPSLGCTLAEVDFAQEEPGGHRACRLVFNICSLLLLKYTSDPVPAQLYIFALPVPLLRHAMYGIDLH